MEWETNMEFGNFFDRVCEALVSIHGWKAPQSHLMANTQLLTPIYNGYQRAMHELTQDSLQTRGVLERVDWPAHITSTAFDVNKDG